MGRPRRYLEETMKLLRLFALLIFAIPAQADTLFPMPSVPDITDADGWAFALGAGLEYGAEYDGSDNYGAEVEPAIIVQKRNGNQMWFFEGQELGWRARLADVWMLQVAGRFEGGREESEAPELAGMGDVDDEFMLVAESRRALGSWDNWLAARVMAGGSDIGTLGVIAAGHTFAQSQPGMGIDLFAFVTLASSEFINRDFGVTPEQSINTGYPVTELGAGFRSFGFQFVGRWRPGDNWQLQAEAGYEKYSSEISESPLTLNDYEAEIGISLLYRF
jgi:outer membrane scaffolding protein for murein synthesis (MipA/OmpV family)